mgnify:CR=1 FL=1
MKGYVVNIEKETLGNANFRKVLYTDKNSQLVLMSLAPGEEIGEEIHQLDQFIRIEKGSGKTVLGGVEYPITDGWAIVVPQGTKHNVINTGTEPMKIYTVYSPPNHKDGTVHATKAEAEGSSEHFDGIISEAV